MTTSHKSGGSPIEKRTTQKESKVPVVDSGHLTFGKRKFPIENGAVIVPPGSLTQMKASDLPADLKLRFFQVQKSRYPFKPFDWIEILKTPQGDIVVSLIRDLDPPQWSEIITIPQWKAIINSAVLTSFDGFPISIVFNQDRVVFLANARTVGELFKLSSDILETILLKARAFHFVVADQQGRF